MKKSESILACLNKIIKKLFFIKSGDAINHECEKLHNMGENINSHDQVKLTEEYVENYKVTTRWQTL